MKSLLAMTILIVCSKYFRMVADVPSSLSFEFLASLISSKALWAGPLISEYTNVVVSVKAVPIPKQWLKLSTSSGLAFCKSL